jgi:hypothetical protein
MPEKQIIQRSKLNPPIPEVEIGVREKRKIKIYPLSLADQFKTTDLITQAMNAFFQNEQAGGNIDDMEFVGYMVTLIKDNIGTILSIATDERGEDLISEITNIQAVVIAEHVFDMNYGEAIKNAQSLIGKVKKLFPSMGPSAQLLNDTQDIDLKIATEKPSEKAA